MGAPKLLKPIEMREADFYRLIKTYKKYPDDMLEAFYSYWSEKNKSASKMRFELEKTWDTGRRLGTWDRNNFGSKSKVQAPVVHMMSPKQEPVAANDIERLDSLLALYSKNPTSYSIEKISQNWPVSALNNCYQAIKENRLWCPEITKSEIEGKDERTLKAFIIVRTLDWYGCKGFNFSDILKMRNGR